MHQFFRVLKSAKAVTDGPKYQSMMELLVNCDLSPIYLANPRFTPELVRCCALVLVRCIELSTPLVLVECTALTSDVPWLLGEAVRQIPVANHRRDMTHTLVVHTLQCLTFPGGHNLAITPGILDENDTTIKRVDCPIPSRAPTRQVQRRDDGPRHNVPPYVTWLRLTLQREDMHSGHSPWGVMLQDGVIERVALNIELELHMLLYGSLEQQLFCGRRDLDRHVVAALRVGRLRE